MKKFSIIILLVFSTVSYCQDAIDAMAKETCECINKKFPDISKSNAGEIEDELGSCLLTSYMAHKEELKPEDKTELTNQEGMKNLGEKVAMKMLTHCPAVIIELGKSSNDEEAVEVANLTLSGQFVESKSNEFVTISLKDASGRTHSLVLLNPFENSSLITDNSLKKNDKIEVEYYEQEFYDPKAKDFRYYKVLQGLKKI